MVARGRSKTSESHSKPADTGNNFVQQTRQVNREARTQRTKPNGRETSRREQNVSAARMNKRWNGRIAWQASISRSAIDRSLENRATITLERSASLRRRSEGRTPITTISKKQWKWARRASEFRAEIAAVCANRAQQVRRCRSWPIKNVRLTFSFRIGGFVVACFADFLDFSRLCEPAGLTRSRGKFETRRIRKWVESRRWGRVISNVWEATVFSLKWNL